MRHASQRGILVRSLQMAPMAIGLLGGGTSEAADTTLVIAAPLNQARMGHSAARLPDGRVAVFSGHGPGFVSLADAEVYSPSENSWTHFDLPSSHDAHALIRLSDGHFLMVGGSSNLGVPASDQIDAFDPSSGTFSRAGTTVRFRSSSGGTQLTGGRVLLAGGWWTHNAAHTFGDCYDPSTTASVATGAMNTPRSSPLVFPTRDGSAVVVGGIGFTGSPVLPTPELYSASENNFTQLGPELFPKDPGWMVAPFFSGCRIIEDYQLPDGRYLCPMYRTKAGANEQGLFTFDPDTKSFARFATTPALPESSQEILAGPPHLDLNSKTAHLLCIVPNSSPQRIYLRTLDLATGVTAVLPGVVQLPAEYTLGYASVTRLNDGRLLVAGGSEPGKGNFGALANCFLITPGSNQSNPHFFTESFGGTSVTPALEDRENGFLIDGGVLHAKSNRNYLRTVAADYRDLDFEAEVVYRMDGGGGAAGFFFGIGPADKDGWYYDEPLHSLFAVDHAGDFPYRGTAVRSLPNPGSPMGFFDWSKEATLTDGTNALRLVKVGNHLTFEMDHQHDFKMGFIADYSGTITLDKVPFLDGTNSHLFFGTASSPTCVLKFRVSELVPSLSITRAAEGISLSWPTTSGTPWRLQTAPNLGTATWTETPGPYPVKGSVFEVIHPIGTETTLFRLFQP